MLRRQAGRKLAAEEDRKKKRRRCFAVEGGRRRSPKKTAFSNRQFHPIFRLALRALSASPQISLKPCFSGVLRAERANVNRFNGFRAAVSATLDKAGMRPPLSARDFRACSESERVGPGIVTFCILARSFLVPLALKPASLSLFSDPSPGAGS